jgi:hypothetical protein
MKHGRYANLTLLLLSLPFLFTTTSCCCCCCCGGGGLLPGSACQDD